jgi:magnesium transporter
MDNGFMEKIEYFKKEIKVMEEQLLHNNVKFNEMDLYYLKKEMLEFKLSNPDSTEINTLIELIDALDTTFDKDQSQKMNHKLNLLTIWSTIFLPLSFYTGMWGMNFDDIPLLTGDNGFWIFAGLTALTIITMLTYFNKHKWF